MLRIAFGCAAFMLLASTLGAQQSPPDQPLPAQTVPDQTARPSQPTPASPQTESELPPPPPFVPPPPARFYDTGHRMAHHHATRHRHATRVRHAAGPRHGKAHHHVTQRHHAVHASKRTIRECHKMSYKQIMRHSICRALMRQDLEVAEHRHHRSSHHQRATHRRSRHHRGN